MDKLQEEIDGNRASADGEVNVDSETEAGAKQVSEGGALGGEGVRIERVAIERVADERNAQTSELAYHD